MLDYQNNELTFQGKQYKFYEEIESAFQWQEYAIVTLKLGHCINDINNIYGIKNGHIAWQVQDQRHYKPELLRFDGVFGYYAAVAVYDENPDLLVANDTAGFRYLIDPNTGIIVGQAGWTK